MSRQIGVSLKATVATLAAAEEKYLTDPEAGPYEAELHQEGVPHFSPWHLLAGMGQVIRGTSNRDVQMYFIPTSRSVINGLREEAARIRDQRDAVIAGKSNSVTPQALAVRLEAALRAMKAVNAFSVS